MAKGQVLINGDGYSSADVSCNLLGRTIEGLRAINFSTSQVKEDTPGRGGESVERIRGNKSRSGSIRVTAKEAAAIKRSLPPNKDITDVAPFPIVLTIVNESNVPVIYTLNYAEFTGDGFQMDAGTAGMEEEFPLIIGSIIVT